MKEFKLNGVTYSIKQRLADGIQYRAEFSENDVGVEAWAYIPGGRHTRQQVVDAINEVNDRASNREE